MPRPALTSSLAELHEARDDDEDRPCDFHEPPRYDIKRPQKEDEAEKDNEDRQRLVASAPARLAAHTHVFIFHFYMSDI